jgi:hypothetical protein
MDLCLKRERERNYNLFFFNNKKLTIKKLKIKQFRRKIRRKRDQEQTAAKASGKVSFTCGFSCSEKIRRKCPQADVNSRKIRKCSCGLFSAENSAGKSLDSSSVVHTTLFGWRELEKRELVKREIEEKYHTSLVWITKNL